MTSIRSEQQLRNALSTLTVEEREAMVYGIDHPQEFGAECVALGSFIRKNHSGPGYCFCPLTLMMLRLGQAQVITGENGYPDLVWNEQGSSASKAKTLWWPIDNYLDDGRSSSDQSRIDETVTAIKRICQELSATE